MKNKLFLFIRIAVAVILIIFLFKNIDFVTLWHKIKTARVDFIIIGLSMYSVIALLAIIRWQLLLNVHDVKPSFFVLCRLFFVGLFFNNAMPGSTGGDIIKGYYIAKETSSHKHEAVTTVFIDRVVGIISLFLIGFIAILFNLQDEKLRTFAYIIIIFFASLIIFMPIFLSKRLMKKIPFIEKIISLIPFKNSIYRVYNAFYKYKSHYDVILYGILLSLSLQAIHIVMVYILGLSISLDIKLVYYFMFIPIIATMSALPVSISGLGVNENLFAYCFGIVGANPESSVAIALMNRFVLLIWGLPGWYFYVASGKSKVSEEAMEKELKSIETES